jgi:hypothetical protein
VRGDAGMPSHGVTHQAADAPVSVRERMNVVKPMMSSGEGDDPTRAADTVESVAFRKVLHEIVDARTRWRMMPTHCYVVLRPGSPLPWHHRELSADAGYPQHRLWGFPIEFPMQPLNELLRRGLRKSGQTSLAIDFRLNAHVCSRLGLQITSALVAVELTGERTLDLLGPSVVTFDKVAVVRVHDADERRKICRRARVQRTTEFGRYRRQLSSQIGDTFWRVLESRRLNALDRFDGLVWPI